MSQIDKEKQEYVSLPYFGLPKLLPYLKPYRWTIFSMVLFGLLTSSIDIINLYIGTYKTDSTAKKKDDLQTEN